MFKFIGILPLLFAFVQQNANVLAAPSDRILIIEFSRDDSKNQQQDNNLKLANDGNGIDDLKLTNVIIPPALPKIRTNFNGTTTNVEQQQQQNSNPLSVSVKLENKTAVGNQFSITFTDTSFLLVCSVKFRIAVPRDTTLVNYWNMSPVPNTADEFTSPDNIRLYPGSSYTAGLTLDGNVQPEIVILDTVTVLSTEKCPNDA